MNHKSYVHQISEIGPRERVRLRASVSAVASERRCVGVDRRRRESEGKAKIEGYMSVSDEEAHHREVTMSFNVFVSFNDRNGVLFSESSTCNCVSNRYQRLAIYSPMDKYFSQFQKEKWKSRLSWCVPGP